MNKAFTAVAIGGAPAGAVAVPLPRLAGDGDADRVLVTFLEILVGDPREAVRTILYPLSFPNSGGILHAEAWPRAGDPSFREREMCAKFYVDIYQSFRIKLPELLQSFLSVRSFPPVDRCVEAYNADILRLPNTNSIVQY